MPDEIDDIEAPEEELNKKAKDSSASTEQGDEKPANIKKKSGKLKWFLVIFVLLILAISGLGIKFAPEHFNFLIKKDFQPLETGIDEDNLSEEILSPFIIPPGSARDAVRIDLSIVWDGLASIRFKKKELGLRQMMYERFYKIAEESNDLSENIPFIENEISILLRKSIGVQNLIIKIKEIRHF